ncbi:hypothetical protein CspeluHIS016_0802010 [Cutaneotrichosporon spelunceum]|uniref:Aminoglycoside phosphotransferase domain-containing protein n=1 Tax=Cutaneotrichosporon spelunceum TaxID=1672016 RepID=A0AAD3TZ84_9TREE|nr:hypothetical protein CspeluHIS016_0802010 [Cutaneotrichosporon spelunceum]
MTEDISPAWSARTPPTPDEVASILLSWIGLELSSFRPLQTLWAGYGEIVSISGQSGSATATPLIMKLINPPPGNDEGHVRKMLSYEVEQEFYATVAPSLDVPLARCLSSTRDRAGRPHADRLDGILAMTMTDLRTHFPIPGEKRGHLPRPAVHAALDWLARLHASTRGAKSAKDMDSYLLPPLEEAARRQHGAGGSKLWLNGGYTYLATRRDELATLASSSGEWSALCSRDTQFGQSVAEAVAAVLVPRGRAEESVIHGDVKSENMFIAHDGSVAFCDFQYAGLGLGVCDLAKLFTCSVPVEMLWKEDGAHSLAMQPGEKELLERYRATLGEYGWDEMVRHWETALVDWCRFQASWGFWGNTEWLEARVRHILADVGWRAWMVDELGRVK